MIDFVSNNNNSIAGFFDAVNRFVNYGAPWLSRIQGVVKLYTSFKLWVLETQLTNYNIEFIFRMAKNEKIHI